jgi:hypothetical protein
MNNKLLHKLLTLLVLFTGINTYAANISVTASITTNTSWTNNNTYILYGDIIVKSGATLTIQEGTIVKGDKTTLSRLVVAIGGKLVAQGTPEQPIVFTSNQAAGSRSRADWAGLAVCGRAPVNFRDGSGNSAQGRLECGTTTDYDYGGSIADDSSGVISYVRIEYAGFVCGSNSELNSLTMGGVGNRTKIDHVMVSFGQDDGYEFFGGTVNANHIISYGSRDDDFDTDNGYSGKVQYGLVIRVDTIADQGDISNAFESDNDANGTFNDPYTKAVFSNITVVGPAVTSTSVVDPKYGWGARIRRASGLNIFNSIFMGYKRGLRIEGSASQGKASADTLEFKNNIIAGSIDQAYETSFDSTYLYNSLTANKVIGGNANDSVQLVSPFGNPAQFDFTLQPASIALTGASFTNAKLGGLTTTTFRGAFGTEDWTACWAEFTPNDEVYTSSPINYGFNVNIAQSGSLPAGVTLTADNVAGASYNWSTGGSTAAVTVTAPGTYTVTVINARGCQKTQTATVLSTGVEDLNSTVQHVRLYPNPNNGSATIEIGTSVASDAIISITDLTGRNVMMMNKELANGINLVAINTADFAGGVYFVNVNNGTENKVVRMVVNK